MQIHQLQPKTKQRRSRRIGRGGKRGTYAGRGMKGQKSRAGTRFQPRIRELLKRYPKLRGFRRKSTADTAVVNVGALEKAFAKGDTVSPETLAGKNILATMGKRRPRCKILGQGDITKALTIECCEVSQGAKDKIEKAGGTIVSS